MNPTHSSPVCHSTLATTPRFLLQLPALVAIDNRLQHAFPVIGAMHVAGTPFQIAQLVELEKGMMAGASEVSVGGRSFLVAMGRG